MNIYVSCRRPECGDCNQGCDGYPVRENDSVSSGDEILIVDGHELPAEVSGRLVVAAINRCNYSSELSCAHGNFIRVTS